MRKFLAACLALLLLPAPAMAEKIDLGQFVRTLLKTDRYTITYQRKKPAGLGPNSARLCLVNTTGQRKVLKFSAVTPTKQGELTVPSGTRVCALFSTTSRVDFQFRDENGKVLQRDRMTLATMGNAEINFIWTDARPALVQACIKQRCDPLLGVAVGTRPNEPEFSRYSIVTMICILGCEMKY